MIPFLPESWFPKKRNIDFHTPDRWWISPRIIHQSSAIGTMWCTSISLLLYCCVVPYSFRIQIWHRYLSRSLISRLFRFHASVLRKLFCFVRIFLRTGLLLHWYLLSWIRPQYLQLLNISHPFINSGRWIWTTISDLGDLQVSITSSRVILWTFWDSNPGPTGYEPVTLTCWAKCPHIERHPERCL